MISDDKNERLTYLISSTYLANYKER
jgi:hypothetical protein